VYIYSLLVGIDILFITARLNLALCVDQIQTLYQEADLLLNHVMNEDLDLVQDLGCIIGACIHDIGCIIGVSPGPLVTCGVIHRAIDMRVFA
jgi:hypothetical protein